MTRSLPSNPGHSGYAINFDGECYTNVPTSLYTASTVCRVEAAITSDVGYSTATVTFTYAGIAVTEEAYIQTASIPLITTILPSPTDVAPLEFFTGVMFKAAATLVHKGSGDGGTGDGTTSNGTTSSGGASNDGASTRAGTGGLAKVLAIWTISALVGAALTVFR
jgi:hypothetical protein